MTADARLVVDACVVAKWFVPEEHREASLRIRDSKTTLIAPALVVVEVGSVFLKKMRAGEVNEADAVGALERVPSLLTIVPTDAVYFRAYELAIRHRRSFYDSIYVALALLEGCPFITADERLYNGLRTAFPETMVWIGDVPLGDAEVR